MDQKTISKNEKFEEIKRKVSDLESAHQGPPGSAFDLKHEIQNLVNENRLLNFETYYYNQRKSKRQRRKLEEILKETGIIRVQDPFGLDELFILPPGSRLISISEVTRKSIVITTIQLPNGKMIRFIDRPPIGESTAYGHFSL